MINKLLLTTFETILIIAVGILVLIFAYLLFGRIFYNISEKIKNKKGKKLIKKALEESGEIVETNETKPDKKQNKYTEILEKVHQNREQYFTEVDTVAEAKQNSESQIVEDPQGLQISDEFSPEDFDVLEKIDFNNENFNFAPFLANNEQQNVTEQDFAAEFKRKRIIKRNQTIGSEIRGCSNRIKAIIALDIINKTKF